MSFLDRLEDARALALWAETNALLTRIADNLAALTPPAPDASPEPETVEYVDDALEQEPEPDESAGLEEPPHDDRNAEPTTAGRNLWQRMTSPIRPTR